MKKLIYILLLFTVSLQAQPYRAKHTELTVRSGRIIKVQESDIPAPSGQPLTPEPSGAINIIFQDDFEEEEAGAFSESDWTTHFEGIDGVVYTNFMSSIYGRGEYSSEWPRIESETVDIEGGTTSTKKLQLTQPHGTDGNDVTPMDYEIIVGDFDSTKTDRYFSIIVKVVYNVAWADSMNENAHWKMPYVEAGTWWDYDWVNYPWPNGESLESWEHDSTLWYGHGWSDQLFYGLFSDITPPKRQRRFDWVKNKFVGKGTLASTGENFKLRTYHGGAYQRWLYSKDWGDPVDTSDFYYRSLDSDEFDVTLRIYVGDNRRANGFHEYFINGKWAYRVDNEKWQSYDLDLGEELDFDSLVIRDIGLSINTIGISYHWNKSRQPEETGASIRYDNFVLWEYADPDYDSAYYNLPSPFGRTLEHHPTWDIEGGYRRNGIFSE